MESYGLDVEDFIETHFSIRGRNYKKTIKKILLAVEGLEVQKAQDLLQICKEALVYHVVKWNDGSPVG